MNVQLCDTISATIIATIKNILVAGAIFFDGVDDVVANTHHAFITGII